MEHRTTHQSEGLDTDHDANNTSHHYIRPRTPYLAQQHNSLQTTPEDSNNDTGDGPRGSKPLRKGAGKRPSFQMVIKTEVDSEETS